MNGGLQNLLQRPEMIVGGIGSGGRQGVPGRRLTLADCEDIACLRGHRLGVRESAAQIGRDLGTVRRR